MTAYKHAENMRLYALDAAETDTPWVRWEVAVSTGQWSPLPGHPNWSFHVDYRRKPKTIRIGERDVPEPMRVAPQDGTKYWTPNFFDRLHAFAETWDGGECDKTALKNGVCHTNCEAAIAHAEALILVSGGTL